LSTSMLINIQISVCSISITAITPKDKLGVYLEASGIIK
jgi:hypothetical protein